MNLKAKIVILSTAVIITAGSFVMTAFINEREEKTPVISSSYPYILKEYNNTIAIFKDNEKIPALILDVVLSELPPRDITLLKEGIPAKTLEQALAMAEDYE